MLLTEVVAQAPHSERLPVLELGQGRPLSPCRHHLEEVNLGGTLEE